MEGSALEKFVYCCGFKQICKIYDLPSDNCLWKRLYFLDECIVCRQSIAFIKICSYNGSTKTIKRCSGEKAVELRDKLSLKALKFYKVEKGTLENERCYYNNFGIIYNFNNKRIGTNAWFCPDKKEFHGNKCSQTDYL